MSLNKELVIELKSRLSAKNNHPSQPRLISLIYHSLIP